MTGQARCVGFLLLAFSLFATSVAVAAGPALPDVSPEGLPLVKNTELAAVYMKEGADFSGYDKVKILDSYVAFKKNWQRDHNASTMMRVSDSDVTRIKADVAKEFKKVFSKELTAKGETVVTTDGSGVLVLRPAIINLDVSAPDTREAGMSHVVSASAGEMTLYLELYDSVTSDLLARVMDPKADRGAGRFMARNEMTNRQDADRILKKWADILGEFLQHARTTDAAGQ